MILPYDCGVALSDSAFLWETEALRAVSRPVPAPRPEPQRTDEDWVTLREASEVTGVPVATLRKWAIRDGVPTYLESTPVGQLRMVSLRGVYGRADDLGRKVSGRGLQAREKPADAPRALTSPDAERSSQPEVPEGTMLVPLDAWNKVLNQLGNLHEAGQQLAEARERAAKAETEAAFLRERLAELRAQQGGSAETVPEPPAPAVSPVRKSPWSAVSGVWATLRRRP